MLFSITKTVVVVIAVVSLIDFVVSDDQDEGGGDINIGDITGGLFDIDSNGTFISNITDILVLDNITDTLLNETSMNTIDWLNGDNNDDFVTGILSNFSNFNNLTDLTNVTSVDTFDDIFSDLFPTNITNNGTSFDAWNLDTYLKDVIQDFTIITLNVSEFYKKVQTMDYDVLIDVRTIDEWDTGRIDGATLMENLALYNSSSSSSVLNDTDTIITTNTSKPSDLMGCESCTIIAYCRSGARAMEALTNLRLNNFTGILYNGLGVSQWTDAGYELNTDTESVIPLCTTDSNVSDQCKERNITLPEIFNIGTYLETNNGENINNNNMDGDDEPTPPTPTSTMNGGQQPTSPTVVTPTTSSASSNPRFIGSIILMMMSVLIL